MLAVGKVEEVAAAAAAAAAAAVGIQGATEAAASEAVAKASAGLEGVGLALVVRVVVVVVRQASDLEGVEMPLEGKRVVAWGTVLLAAGRLGPANKVEMRVGRGRMVDAVAAMASAVLDAGAVVVVDQVMAVDGMVLVVLVGMVVVVVWMVDHDDLATRAD